MITMKPAYSNLWLEYRNLEIGLCISVEKNMLSSSYAKCFLHHTLQKKKNTFLPKIRNNKFRINCIDCRKFSPHLEIDDEFIGQLLGLVSIVAVWTRGCENLFAFPKTTEEYLIEYFPPQHIDRLKTIEYSRSGYYPKIDTDTNILISRTLKLPSPVLVAAPLLGSRHKRKASLPLPMRRTKPTILDSDINTLPNKIYVKNHQVFISS